MVQEKTYGRENGHSVQEFKINVNTDSGTVYFALLFMGLSYLFMGIPMVYWPESWGYVSGIVFMVVASIMSFMMGELSIGSLVMGGWGSVSLLIAKFAPVVIEYIGMIGFYIGTFILQALLEGDW